VSARERLRVQVVIDTLTWGGAEMLLADLAAGAEAAGLDLSVAYLKDLNGSPAAARLRGRGIEPELVPMTLLHNPAGFARIRRHLAAERPDVVHTHLGYADLLAGTAAATLRIPSVSTLHVMEWSDERRERVKDRMMAAARHHLAARVITLSDPAREAYLAKVHDRPRHVVKLHNGIEGAARPGEGPAVRRELGLEADDVVAAVVSVLRRGKGHALAAEAVADVRERHPRLKLLVLGDGPDRDEVARAVAPLGDAAVMAGHRDDVMRVLDAVDVLLHPTAVDAFPTALLEAMAASVPVVATRVGGVPEIVEHGSTGLLVAAPPRERELAAALESLVSDAGVRERLGRAGRERFESEFTAARWAERLRALYESVLAERSRGARRPR
jgi:glycosyltransferase involved in cell wall biosynthesis